MRSAIGMPFFFATASPVLGGLAVTTTLGRVVAGRTTNALEHESSSVRRNWQRMVDPASSRRAVAVPRRLRKTSKSSNAANRVGVRARALRDALRAGLSAQSTGRVTPQTLPYTHARRATNC